ncbi:hypothetical protein [Nannocystis pusilla]|uniref:hypothetical protein n=1 Tax=Nannocystis pusilla TaxID=889268 RepID=UPI003B808018
MSIFILGTAVIPRGHEIEFVTYVKPAKGFLSVKSTYAVLTDLVTGVVYTPWVSNGETPAWEGRTWRSRSACGDGCCNATSRRWPMPTGQPAPGCSWT